MKQPDYSPMPNLGNKTEMNDGKLLRRRRRNCRPTNRSNGHCRRIFTMALFVRSQAEKRFRTMAAKTLLAGRAA
jgi:hypothetical protein